ncbi:zinc finger protein 595-like [Galleria mellonella]|uniref:Zinc finger protein 595-like n=1 Tax=Galleria mellonella TaxID=7137 RepID=A0A6J1WWF5_GALME|nr:zinc finger protein 595-like [Galleria mellonella]XP_052748109.1 zinc finger protein 595-like [Galleria mellonella]
MYLVKQNNLFEVLACRGCLATDVKLYDMFENKLFEHFGRLVGVPVLADDGYPHHLCAMCAVHLQKFIAYRNICRKAQDKLEEAEVRGIRITTSYIRKMDRKKHTFLNYIKKELFNITLLDSNGYDEKTIDSDEKYEVIVNPNESVKKTNYTVTKQEVVIENGFSNIETEFVTIDNKLKSELNPIDVEDTNITSFFDNFSMSNDIFEITNDVATTNNTVDLTAEEEDSKTKIDKPRIILKKKKKVKDVKLKNKKGDVIDITKKFAEEYNFELTVFTREEQLEEVRALKEKPTNKLQCDDCGIGFNSKSKLLNHYKNKHDPSLGEYVCPICNSRFRQKRYLHKHHLFVHLFKYVCKVCDFNTRSRSTAEGHAAFHAGKVFTCDCGKSFGHLSSYLSHKRLTHTSKLKGCEYCGESFIGEKGLLTHKRKIHSDIPETWFVCEKCNAKFRTDDALAKHQSLYCGGYNCVNCGDIFTAENLLTYHLVQNHNHRNISEEPSECNACNTKFHNHAALRRHLDKCGQVVPCVQCGEGFDTEDEMNEHLNTHTTDYFKCEVCNGTYKSAYNFAEHYAKHIARPDHVNVPGHLRNPAFRGLRDDGKIMKVARKVMCEICGKLCMENAYPTHLKTHSDEKEYKCTICSKQFSVLMSLQGHMRVHTNERPFECDYCKKKFKLRGAVVRHIMGVHLGVRPHQCHLCQKYFKTSTCVKMHIKTVHMKIPMPPRIRKRRPKSTDMI